MPTKVKRWVILSDIHHPEMCKSAFSAVLDFIRRNKTDGVVLLGDNMNCENVSRHTKGKPGLRTKGGVQNDFDTFDRDVMIPLELTVPKGCTKVWFEGNHEAWLAQWLEENPEFDGAISFDKSLHLTKRGWKMVAQGEHYNIGKAYLIHGDQVGSGMYVAKKLVDSYCATAIMGHVHTASMMTKTSQVKKRDKWIGITLPTLGTVSPKYAKGQPNTWLNGFGIVEEQADGFVNVYIPIIFDGMFSFGGEVYGR
jgi:UDP-2,3-diacylglucosamine pyrophosphatase LpxH